MSDYDQNRLDPDRQSPPQEPLRDPRDVPFEPKSSFSWTWVLGGVAAIVVLLVAMSFINDRQRSAEGIAPSQETTGQSAPTTERPLPRPASPNPSSPNPSSPKQ